MATILVVESSAGLRQAMKIVLELAGHRAVLFGEDDHRTATGVDAIVIDPAVAGGEAWARELRRRRPGLPLIWIGDTPTRCDFTPAARLPRLFGLRELEREVELALEAAA